MPPVECCHPEATQSESFHSTFALIYMQSFISSTDEKLNFVCRTRQNFTEMWLESCFDISIQIYAAICQQHVIIQRKSKLSSFHDLLANCKELWTSFFSIILNFSRYLCCSPVAASYLGEFSQSEAFSRFEDQQPGKLVNVSPNCVCWQMKEMEGKNFSECDLNI